MKAGRRRAGLRPGHVGVRARAGPLRHADGADAAAALDRRLHRVDGGPLLRVLGHHAVPLPQPVRALGGAVPGPAGPALRAPRRRPGGRAPPADGRDVLPDLLGDGSGPGRRRRGPDRGGDLGAVDGLRGGRAPTWSRRWSTSPPCSPMSARGRASGWSRPWSGTWTPLPTTCSWPPTARPSGPGSRRARTRPRCRSNRSRSPTSRRATTASASTWTRSASRSWSGRRTSRTGTSSGAEGPYRVTPNLMVVVPTDTHVELHYGWTPVDLIAWLLTLLGIGGVVLLARRPDLDVPAPPVPVAPSVYGDDPPDVLDEDPDSGPGGGPARRRATSRRRPTRRTRRCPMRSRWARGTDAPARSGGGRGGRHRRRRRGPARPAGRDRLAGGGGRRHGAGLGRAPLVRPPPGHRPRRGSVRAVGPRPGPLRPGRAGRRRGRHRRPADPRRAGGRPRAAGPVRAEARGRGHRRHGADRGPPPDPAADGAGRSGRAQGPATLPGRPPAHRRPAVVPPGRRRRRRRTPGAGGPDPHPGSRGRRDRRGRRRVG